MTHFRIYKKSPAVGTSTGDSTINNILRFEGLLIQCIIRYPSLFGKIGDLVQELDFVDDGYGGLYVALKSQYETTGDIDFYAAMEAFRFSAGLAEGSHDDGCRADMARMVTDLCPWWHWRYYLQRVIDASYRRRLVEICQANAADAADPFLSAEDVARICEDRAKRLHGLRRGKPTPNYQVDSGRELA